MSSYALRRVRLTPTMGLVAWMIASTKEGSISYPKLEQLLFLVDWKLAQSTGKPIIETQWQHDNEEVTAPGFFKRLVDDGHFVLTDTKRPERARVSLARPLEDPMEDGTVQAVGTQFRFLNGQAPSALKKMCKDAFPFRSVPARRPFYLHDRLLAYKQSRR